MKNDESCQPRLFGHLGFVIVIRHCHSSFVIRHSSFVIERLFLPITNGEEPWVHAAQLKLCL